MPAHSFETNLFIDGAYVAPKLGGTFDCINPSTGALICKVANGTAEDIDLAVKAATACLNGPDWGYKSTGALRAVVLRKLGAILEARTDEIAKIDCLDEGKPLREAQADIGDAVAGCKHFAELAEERDKIQGEVIENHTDGDFVTTIMLEPLGVIGAITPWNYPLLMALWKLLPCIAAGCTMVLKPSELAPLSCILLGALCKEAGLPKGALNVVQGLGLSAGNPLTLHPGIDKISFTGSAPTARRIMANCALGPRAISLELGGKSPAIVFEDVEIESTADWIMTGFVWGSGQVCSSTSRVCIHESIYEKVCKKLVEKCENLRIGDVLSEEMMKEEKGSMGPVVSADFASKIWGFINRAAAANVKILYGGTNAALPPACVSGGGSFVPPTIYMDVDTNAEVWKEEIFGPVLCVRSFKTEEEGVAVCNDSIYGLAAAVFSADLERAARVANQMRAGIVWKNCSQPAFIQAPWGGVKASGFGRELGRWGMEEFTSVKHVSACKPGYTWALW